MQKEDDEGFTERHKGSGNMRRGEASMNPVTE